MEEEYGIGHPTRIPETRGHHLPISAAHNSDIQRTHGISDQQPLLLKRCADRGISDAAHTEFRTNLIGDEEGTHVGNDTHQQGARQNVPHRIADQPHHKFEGGEEPKMPGDWRRFHEAAKT